MNYIPGELASEARMKQMYAEVMLFGARQPADVQRKIVKMQDDCVITGASFGNEVARRVSQTDQVWVSNSLAH